MPKSEREGYYARRPFDGAQTVHIHAGRVHLRLQIHVVSAVGFLHTDRMCELGERAGDLMAKIEALINEYIDLTVIDSDEKTGVKA